MKRARAQLIERHRLTHRQQRAPEWLDGIREKCRELGPRVLPQSEMGKPIRYTVNPSQIAVSGASIFTATILARLSSRTCRRQ